MVLATTAGIDVSNDGGATWTQAETGPRGSAAGQPGFRYVGMTDRRQGVAVPADPQLREVIHHCRRRRHLAGTAGPGLIRQADWRGPVPAGPGLLVGEVPGVHPQPAQHAEHLLELRPGRNR